MDETQPPAQSGDKILIIRFSSIGDIVLTTPIVRAIKEQIPQAEIHYLTKASNAGIPKSSPYISKVITFNGNIKDTVNVLKQEQYDFVVDLQKNRRSLLITRALHKPHGTFNKHNIKKWIYVNLKINFLPMVHIVDRYFDAVKKIGVVNDGKGLDFFISQEDRIDEMNLPMVFEDGFVSVVLGSAHGTKRIPAQKIVEIATILHKPIMLLGGSDVVNMAEEIVSRLGDRAFNWCGKLTLNQSASILQQSDCVITGDTGLMHIAAALSKPIASLWGNTVPEFGMYPYMPEHPELYRIFEVPRLRCRPCSKFGYKKCPRKHYKCMSEISVLEVAEWINKF